MFDFLVLKTSQITVKHTETLFTVEVDINEHATRTARDHDIR